MENNSLRDKSTAYGAIGLAIFLIFFGVSYLIPNFLPEGSMFIVAGSLILLVNMIKSLKNLDWETLPLQ